MACSPCYIRNTIERLNFKPMELLFKDPDPDIKGLSVQATDRLIPDFDEIG